MNTLFFYLCLKVVLSNKCFKSNKTNYKNNLEIKKQRQFYVKNKIDIIILYTSSYHLRLLCITIL